jgi:uncharacterized protein (DUF1697 family)
MIYVALLRGINVGGNNKVSMMQLKLVFEQASLTDVKTYINSGNVIFRDESRMPEELVYILEKAILSEFGFAVSVLIRDITAMKATVEGLEDAWKNDTTMKCDVMFLWDDIDNKDTLNQLIIKPEIDTVRYVPGAILFAVERKNVTKSGLMKLIGTPLYKRMTIRNCNTTRKLYSLMRAIEP